MPAMTHSQDAARSFAKKRLAVMVAGSLASVAVGLVAVYGIGLLKRNEAVESACQPASEIARRIAPLARGELAALTVAATPRRLPELAFRDAAGRPKTLADWRGRTVLLNLWATWCAPCRKEMPALDALQGRLGGPRFEVVAINIDTRDPAKPKEWLKEVGVAHLAYYADPTAKVFQDLKVIGKAPGLPTTLLIDPAGCELAALAGPAEWASEDALALIRAALPN